MVAAFHPVVIARSRGCDFCPFVEVAASDPPTVCQLHLGLAEGAAAVLDEGAIVDLMAMDPRRAECRVRIRLSVLPVGGKTTSTLGQAYRGLEAEARSWPKGETGCLQKHTARRRRTDRRLHLGWQPRLPCDRRERGPQSPRRSLPGDLLPCHRQALCLRRYRIAARSDRNWRRTRVAAVVVVGNHRRRCRPRRRPGAHHRRRHGPGPR